MDPLSKPGVLVAGHAPFCWGATPADAAHTAVVLEEIACLAYHALAINPSATAVSDALRDKHFLRKHGPKAYYGQKKTSGGREDG
jgi:L-ribulose-5-phosphate 4-epimerase